MRYIDLFAGAGGLSEGFTRAGFEAVAHVEMNQDACFTIKTRLAYHFLKDKGKLDAYEYYLKDEISRDALYHYIPKEILASVINAQISDATIESIFSQIDALNGDKKIDLIVGGPPCQAYSVAGRGRIKNINEKQQNSEKQTDERYFLFRQYVKFLEKYQPNMFVFENVTGLVTAGGGVYLEEMCQEFKKIGYEVNIHLDKNKNTEKVDIFDTSNYGVLQSRKRVIVVGCKEGFAFDMSKFKIDTINFNVKKDLLEDLPSLQPNDGHRTTDYTKKATDYQKKYYIRDAFFDFTTLHATRPHNERDLKIYNPPKYKNIYQMLSNIKY